jgi:ribosomal protein L39E
MGIRTTARKVKLSKAGQRTRWAPVWVVIKRFGTGKARSIHPSQITRNRRSWRRTKLHIKPRISKPKHYG